MVGHSWYVVSRKLNTRHVPQQSQPAKVAAVILEAVDSAK